MAEAKTIPTEVKVEDFIKNLEDESQKEGCWTLIKIMSEVTGKEAKMWGPAIIGFDQYHYKYESGREGDMPRLAFSPRKGKFVVYGEWNFDEEIFERLGKFKTGQVCLYITRMSDVNVEVLAELLTKTYKEVNAKYSQ